MKVKMRTNLGTVDASAIGVDAKQCRDGMVTEVSDAAGQWLVKRRFADELPEIHAVPPQPMQAVPPVRTQAEQPKEKPVRKPDQGGESAKASK